MFLLLIALVFISSCSQIMLKKAADTTYSSKWREYCNAPVLFAYGIFFLTTIAVVFILKYVPLSYVAIAQMSAYVFVAVLSYFFLKEKMTRKKVLALGFIIVGILIFIMQ